MRHQSSCKNLTKSEVIEAIRGQSGLQALVADLGHHGDHLEAAGGHRGEIITKLGFAAIQGTSPLVMPPKPGKKATGQL